MGGGNDCYNENEIQLELEEIATKSDRTKHTKEIQVGRQTGRIQ